MTGLKNQKSSAVLDQVTTSDAKRRSRIITNYRSRIKKGKRKRLNAEEQEFLIYVFLSDLRSLKTEREIKARCQSEIGLLEEGYSKETIAKTWLNRYRSAIQQATEEGELSLKETNSKKYEYQKKQGTEKTGDIGQAHHHFGWLYMCYDNDTYIGFKKNLSQF